MRDQQQADQFEVPTVNMGRVRGSNFVEVSLNGVKTFALVDSGATTSIVSSKFAEALGIKRFSKRSPSLKSANGGIINTEGMESLQLKVGNSEFKHTFVIGEIINNLILGIDFLEKHGVTLNFSLGRLEMANQYVSLRAKGDADHSHVNVICHENHVIPVMKSIYM